ncbi:MAG: M56 family metallopeptidase, partial [Ruminiclostridium sp.]|nr:M56 family metallopeptidase [Ruminiclostridium sp.]
MTEVLPVLLRLSLFGSLLALALFALKPLLRGRVSRTVQYYLWLLVLLRLCIPAGLTLTLPEAPVVPVQPPAPAVSQTVQPDTPAPVPEPLPAAAEQVPVPAPDPDPVNWSAILSGIWAVGAALCAGRYLFGYCLLRGKIRRNETAPAPEALALLAELEPSKWVRVVESAAVDTPLLLGPFAPVIVLPPRLTDPGQLRDILAHELTHARRYDLLYKWFAALTVSVHWFNPLMILVRREISRACELACDEAVIKTLDAPARQHYGETLLSLAACAPHALALPMCGEKRNLKERLVSIVKLHQRTPLAILLS